MLAYSHFAIATWIMQIDTPREDQLYSAPSRKFG